MENTAQKFMPENYTNINDENLNEVTSAIFRTIGEVATEIGIPPHVLRFWESKFDTIKPHKRKGGHRYYKQADIQAIKDIKRLLYEEGFTIKGAQKFLKEKHTVDELNTQASLFESPVAKKIDASLFNKNFNDEDLEDERPQQVFKASEAENDNYAKANSDFFNNILTQLNSIKQTLESVK